MDDPITLEAALRVIFEALLVVVGAWLTAPITTVGVNFLKMLLPSVAGETLRLIIAVLMTALSWLAVHLGLGAEFNTLIGVLSQIGGILWGYFENSMRATGIHLRAATMKEQIFGYQRTP